MSHKKKIFDIIPPGEIKKETAKVEPDFVKKTEVSTKKLISEKSHPRLKKTPIFILAGIVFIGILAFVFIQPKAEIEIWPEKELIDFEAQVVIDISIQEIDFSPKEIGGRIPGKMFQIEKSVSQEFPSTGEKLKTAKAHGVIQVYNVYSTNNQLLVATTRFVSDDGKLFRTPKRVIIPGGHYEKGKLVPGSVDIEVIADQPGEEYNIGPSAFSIPGFAGTARYTAFYAKSFEPMEGGMKSGVPEVTQEDLDGAKDALTSRAMEESRVSLESAIRSEDYMTAERAVVQEIIEVSSLAEVGQEIDSFIFKVKAEAETLAFKKIDLEDFVKDFIRSKIPPEKELKENSLSIKHSAKTVDLEGGEITLSLKISAEIYSTINEGFFKQTIKNKKPEEIKDLLKDFPEINKAEVRLWPFWARSVSQDIERIEVKLNLD